MEAWEDARREIALIPDHPNRAPPPPEPEIVNGEERYEVESIENSRLQRGKMEYLVKWKGYTRENNTWEPEGNIDAPRAIADFHRRFPSAPRRIAAAIFAAFNFHPYENLTTTPNVPCTWEEGVRACAS